MKNILTAPATPEPMIHAGITCKGSKESKTDGIVIGIVFGVLILGFAGLIVLSRKK